MKSLWSSYTGLYPESLGLHAQNHLPSEGEQTIFFECLDLYHKSPDSSER